MWKNSRKTSKKYTGGKLAMEKNFEIKEIKWEKVNDGVSCPIWTTDTVITSGGGGKKK